MKLISQYPCTAELIQPYCGRQVVAVTHYGDTITGVIDRVSDGIVYFRPAGAPQAAIRSMQRKVLSHSKVRKIRSKKKATNRNITISGKLSGKAKTSAWGFGYPGFGFGFPGFGLGAAALAFTIPLILLAALFAW
ncbi:hypothetical protein AB6A23_26780 [Paenibacillus tarimensis]